MKKSLIVLFFLLAAGMAQATEKPKGYHFTLTIENNNDTVMYLGNYYAGNTYAIDTAYRNKKGQFVFERKNADLLPGMYFFTNPSGDYVEFMVYRETPNFSFVTDESSWTRNMNVKGSKENELFFQYHHFNYMIRDEVEALKDKGISPDSLKAEQHRKLLVLDSIKEVLINSNPHSMLALMMNATREVPVPKVNESGDSLSDADRYYYYISHYFDNMALEDDALVRTPDMIFHKPLMDYFDRYLKGAKAETICQYIDTLIEKSRPSKEVFKYLVHSITEKYLQSKIMSYDEIYVHMVQKYYATGEAFWSSPSVVDEQVKRATTWERLLIGKPAPELTMKDIEGNVYDTYAMQGKYTLIVFWSPTCGHCKTMIPELYEKFLIYKERFDINAFAVLSEPDEATKVKWTEFIAKHNMTDPRWHNMDGGEANIDWHEVYDVVTTPQIYLLDKDKIILAKKLNAATFENILNILEDENNLQ